MEERLFDRLRGLKKSGFYPFHMPGHKRNKEMMEDLGLWGEGLSPFEIDITEIPEFDDLHEAEGLIKRAEELASSIYGAEKTFFQVNGSTGAILSAIGGVAERGSYVLMARNCHKSVYHAVELFGLKPLYINGIVDGLGIFQEIQPIEVEKSLKKANEEKKRVNLIIITSPTYEGICSPILEISEIAKKNKTLLMVDEAHGAHFGFSKTGYFEETAIRQGANIVVQSLHKTLPSFTSTALLHLNHLNLSQVERIKRKINFLETSSPSYLMMSCMENCLLALQNRGKDLFLRYEKMLKDFYESVKNLQNIQIYDGIEHRDKGKIIISAGRGSGSFLYDYFYEEAGLVMEMKSKDYVIAMTSICDTKEGFVRLWEALRRLDERISRLAKEGNFYYTFEGEEEEKKEVEFPKQRFFPSEATTIVEKNGKELMSPIELAKGRISAENIYFYPPGIPILVAGELIDSNVISQIEEGVKAGIQIYGGSDGNGIFVCADGEECYR